MTPAGAMTLRDSGQGGASPLEPLPTLPAPLRRWVERGCADVTLANGLRDSLNLPEPLCHLLTVRGYGEVGAARDYLKPRLERMHDPVSLAGIANAVERIDSAINAGETILVHGDYDVDGVCGTTLFTRVIRSMGGRVVPFTPLRLRDGYDLTDAGVRAAKEAGATLIVTADCGTVAHAAVTTAKQLGIDVIVTDHHTPGPTLPDAVAVVNPNRTDCDYPDRSLAGVGVAFKVCQALASMRSVDPKSLWYYLDLVAIATIADLAPLRGENRIFTKFGLKLLRETRNPGLAALMVEAGIDPNRPIGGGQISHVLAPRINAVGRMGDAMRGVELLLTDDTARAATLARVLEDENTTRKAIDRQTLREALLMLEKTYDPDRDWGIVLGSNDWHSGVIGIVASRIVERIHRPTILLSIDRTIGRARGSARSIPAFHLYDGIKSCNHLLERFGGHRQAAGLDVRIDRIDALRDAFNAHAHEVLDAEDLVQNVSIDLELRLGDATVEFVDMLRHLGPFGMGNPSPVFVARGVRLAREPRIVGDGHAKLLLGDDSGRIDAIGFGMGDRVRDARAQDRFDVAFHLQVDEWNDLRRPQARLLDLIRSN